MGDTKRVGVVVVGIWSAWALTAERVQACSYLSPCGDMPVLALLGDVTARPTNACIAIQYASVPWYEEPEGVEAAYVAADGRRIALEATAVPRVYCPVEALLPDTDYVFVAPRRDGGCAAREEVELLSFHTGAGPDEVPPTAPGEVRDVRCEWSVCDSVACCGPYETVVHVTEWEPARDASGEVVYLLGGSLRMASTHRWAESGVIQPMPVAPFDLVRPDRVRAVDIAGHIGPDAVIGSRCDAGPSPRDAAVEPDAGRTPDAGRPVDAGLTMDGGMSGSSASNGCSARGGGGRASSLGAGLVGFLFAWVRVRCARVARAGARDGSVRGTRPS
jgi:hypothetical protein